MRLNVVSTDFKPVASIHAPTEGVTGHKRRVWAKVQDSCARRAEGSESPEMDGWFPGALDEVIERGFSFAIEMPARYCVRRG